MTTTVGIPHAESPGFLRACLACIERFGRPDRTLVVDDGSGAAARAELVKLLPPWAELEARPPEGLGAALNRIVDRCDTDYLVVLDADGFPISHRWLTEPISQLAWNGCAMAGSDNEAKPRWHRERGGPAFTMINHLYCAMPAEVAKRLRHDYGFDRTNRPPFEHGCDFAVYANWGCEQLGLGAKRGYPVIGCVGETEHGGFACNVGDLVLHWSFSAGLQGDRKYLTTASQEYVRWTARLLGAEDPVAVVLEAAQRARERAASMAPEDGRG